MLIISLCELIAHTNNYFVRSKDIHMNQIGFKNFRKFKELRPLDLSPVTIFVGENNAGKSTVVKALLSALEFIRTKVSSLEDDSWMNLNFYFNKSYYTHLGTYSRARYNKAKENEPISFAITVGNRIYEIDVEPSDSDADVFGRVSRFKITYIPYNIEITYSLRADHTMTIVFHAHPHPLFKAMEYRISSSMLRSPENYFKGLEKDIEIESTLVSNLKFSSEYIADALLSSFKKRIIATISNLSSKALSPMEEGIFGLTEDAKDFLMHKRTYFQSRRFLSQHQEEINVEYIYAHAVTQTIIFSAKDTNDYHVRTIHEFANLQTGPLSPARDFILKWMDTFKIGRDYEITSVGGEAHLVKIQNTDGQWVNLADKGMGSIQLMILLFRVATKMAETGIGYGKKTVNSLLIIEEPEQNLHPMLQSKLAEFFYSLHKEYGFRFIIETHSEYLIRKSQVLIARENYSSEEELKGNAPFKVIYFPGDGQSPYDMLYRTDGKFSNEFGTGFFDEAANLAFKIL